MERRNNISGFIKDKQFIFVVNAIGRSPNTVVPFKILEVLEWTYKTGISDNYEEPPYYPEAGNNGARPKIARDIEMRDEYPILKDGIDREPKTGGADDPYSYNIAARDVFYSDLCRLTCTEETKNFIANHVSLWKHVMQNADEMPEYIIVIEDDNTITDETFLTNIEDIINVLKENNIDMLQLVTHTRIMKDRQFKRLMLLPDLDAYKGSFDVSLSAYIMKQDAMSKLYTYFINNKPSLDISLELLRLEKTLNLNRYVMDNNLYVRHEYNLKNEYRNSRKTKSSIKSRIDTWIMHNYPSFYNKMYTPLFSVFGKYDITMLFLVAVIIIIGLAIFDVNNKLVWLLSGIFFSYSLN